MDLVEKHETTGMVPSEIKALSPADWNARKTFPYTMLWKLKETEYIVERDGRYFPTGKGQ